MGALTSRVNGLIGGVIGLVVILAVLGATIGLMFTSVADVNTAISTGSTNSTEADAIAPVFPILLGITFLLGLVGVATAAMKFRNK